MTVRRTTSLMRLVSSATVSVFVKALRTCALVLLFETFSTSR